jgi:hypothetical protein
VKPLDFTGFLGRKKPFFFQNTPLTLYPFQPLQSICGHGISPKRNAPDGFQSRLPRFFISRHGFENGKGEAMPRDCRTLDFVRRPPATGLSRARSPPFVSESRTNPTFRKRRKGIWKETKNTGFGSKAGASM